MPRFWSPLREPPYAHIKDRLDDRGYGEDAADEIAARTVNKERARHGETVRSRRTPTHDSSSSRRSGR
jgi:hypothetical protein